MVYELKTKINSADVNEFLNKVENQTRREDAVVVVDMMREVTGMEPAMWGASIVGFGKYHYKYASGHEGEMCRVGFSPRKTSLTIYLAGVVDKHPDLAEKLGKHKTGKGCLYINKLADVDLDVLKELIRETLGFMAKEFPE